MQQSKSAQDKVQDDLYEMSKPLARYKSDEDLDKMLRDRERAEDPMLAFMQKKKAKQDVIAGKKGNILVSHPVVTLWNNNEVQQNPLQIKLCCILANKVA